MDDYKKWRDLASYEAIAKPDEIINMVLVNGHIEQVNWELWTANARAAKKHDLPFVSDLYDTRRGPCIVVGAGPSLARNAASLRIARDCGVDFIATDRALQELRGIGIKESMSVTTECQPECGDFLLAAGRGDVVAVGLHSCESTRDALVERGCEVYNVAFMAPNTAYSKYCAELFGRDVTCVRPGIVVTYMAVDIAVWMGYDPVFTVGNDLCYDDYLSCTADTEIRDDGGRGYIRQLADGRWTFPIFEEAASLFRNFVILHQDRQFFDISGGIAQWPQISTEEMLGRVAKPVLAPSF